MRFTRRVTPQLLERLDTVRLGPVFFQEYVAAEVDSRVTAVDGQLFTAEIYARATANPLDWRVRWDEAAVQPGALPDRVAGQLRAVIGQFGLRYGAFDLRRTASGEHVFVEVTRLGSGSSSRSGPGCP